MSFDWTALCSASIASTITYYVGRLVQLSRDTALEAKEKVAKKALEEIPEGGPELFADVTFRKKDPPDKHRSMWVSCRKCVWNHEMVPGEFKLCVCEAYDKPHFHKVCAECGYRELVRTADDIDRITGTAKIEITNDRNPCECGNSQATTATLPTGADAWRCALCGKLRPKLIGGVTPAVS